MKLGDRFAEGRGVTRNDTEALKWYRQASDKGNSVAVDKVIKMFEDRRGFPQTDAEALKFYHHSAEKGKLESILILGQI